jgi:hypothetical protein
MLRRFDSTLSICKPAEAACRSTIAPDDVSDFHLLIRSLQQMPQFHTIKFSGQNVRQVSTLTSAACMIGINLKT